MMRIVQPQKSQLTEIQISLNYTSQTADETLGIGKDLQEEVCDKVMVLESPAQWNNAKLRGLAEGKEEGEDLITGSLHCFNGKQVSSQPLVRYSV